MADNIPITAGSGTTIATDDVSGVHYQRVKLVDGAADSSTPLAFEQNNSDGEAVGEVCVPVENYNMVFNGTTFDRLRGSINNGALVQPAPKQLRISVTPTINTVLYTTGDCLGELQELANAARYSGGSGIIQSIVVLDRSQAQRAAIDLVFFDRSVTVAGNNAAFATSDADMAYCLGVVSIGPYNTAWPGTPLNSVSTLLNVGLPYVANGTSIYVQPVVRAGPTYAVGDLTFIYGILQD